MSTTTDPTDTLSRCRFCGATAAADQRYCLSCGTRREDVPDPVSRYLSEASAARSRVAAAVARSAEARSSRRLPKLSPLFATALVIVALLVGIEIGHSSSSGHSSSAGGSVATTSTPATSTKSSGSSAVNKVTKSKGKSYVNQESNLPTSVSP